MAPNTEAKRQYLKDYRIRLKARGICPSCNNPLNGNPDKCEHCQKRTAFHNNRYKQIVFDHYGWKCTCCGETTPLFLTIDHINNDGSQQRREAEPANKTKYLRGTNYCRTAILILRGEAPQDLQTLCYNCNCGKQRNGGICPHIFLAGAVPSSDYKFPETVDYECEEQYEPE